MSKNGGDISVNNRKRKEKFEVRLYKRLGIEHFKNATFKLEKIIHFKDKGKNINYHMKTIDEKGAEDFKKFLFYNGSIHVRNSIILTAVLTIKFAFFPTTSFFDIILNIILILNLTKDLYCVMLQRYNYIRLNELIEVLKKRKEIIAEKEALKIEKVVSERSLNLSLNENEKETDLALITKLQLFLSNNANIVIDENDIESLKRIRDFLRLYNANIHPEGNKGSNRIEIPFSEDTTLIKSKKSRFKGTLFSKDKTNE